MMTNIRPEISKKNRWWISKHRYYELRHFSLQYKQWKESYDELMGEIHRQNFDLVKSTQHNWPKPVEDIVVQAEGFANNVSMIEECAKEADQDLYDYLMLAVTQGKTYAYLQTIMDIPCSKEMFYDRYRKFYWLLSKRRM